jgi:hypothetical protein
MMSKKECERRWPQPALCNYRAVPICHCCLHLPETWEALIQVVFKNEYLPIPDSEMDKEYGELHCRRLNPKQRNKS